MTEDTLRTTITTAILTERDSLLQAKIDELRKRHAAEVESAVEKALAAIRGKGKAKAKQPRKPRADKGTKRLGKGLPKMKTDIESAREKAGIAP